MNRDEFYGKLPTFDEDGLRKALWTLYWRGPVATRERIEAELEPGKNVYAGSPRPPVDPAAVVKEVADFVALARSGAYLAGNRRVSPKERTRWRFTFQHHAAAARQALTADPGSGAAAVEMLIDLACETRNYDLFRSDDPLEAARFVVSDAVALLWTAHRDAEGFTAFARRAAHQLIRWESRYGWTRTGSGRVSTDETSLAAVAARLIPIPDRWVEFTDHYLHALDSRGPTGDTGRRTADLAEWHSMLFDRLLDCDAEDRLDLLTTHPALGGPERTFLQARLAHHRGDTAVAHARLAESLKVYPGHREFLALAAEIGAPVPTRRPGGPLPGRAR